MAGILSDVGGIGEAATGVAKVGETLEDSLFRLFPGLDKGAVQKFAQDYQMQQLADSTTAMHDQTEITKVEASNPSLFISGGRAFIIWVCGFALAWNYLIAPMLLFTFAAFGKKGDIFPELNTAEVTGLVTSLLGLTGYHLAERLNGNAPAAEGAIITKRTLKAIPVK